MVITITAVGLNAILTYGLVFGAWGFPALGIAGAGWATTAVNWIMLLSMLIYTARSEGLRRYRVYQNLFDLDLAECWPIIRLGLPIGGIALLEGGLFMAVAVLMGTIGVHALAANQVVINAIAATFMVSLAIGEATGIRVAHGIGAGSMAESRQSGLLGLGLGLVSGVLAGLAFIFGSHLLTGLFLDINNPENAPVIALCTSLFLVAAAFQLFDGLQAIAVRALRGMKDVLVPMWIAALGYWVFGIGGGYILAFVLDYGAQGLWWGLAAGLTFAGIMLSSRFLVLSREH
jgi:MATE family multidrug resistance protein